MSHMHSSSSTTTTTYVQETNRRNEQNGNQSTIVRILKLTPQKMVRWDESTVDNENAQKKSSKVCCIYHKPKKFGESSESDSDSSENEVEKKKKKLSRSGVEDDGMTTEKGVHKL